MIIFNQIFIKTISIENHGNEIDKNYAESYFFVMLFKYSYNSPNYFFLIWKDNDLHCFLMLSELQLISMSMSEKMI